MELTQELVRELFDYHEDGHLVWKKLHPQCQSIKVGNIAGYFDKSNGYYNIKIFGKRYKLHRIIFLYHFGSFNGLIDHKDTNTGNNKIENLRLANESQNNYNSNKSKNNKSGFKGVSWQNSVKKWKVQIDANKKRFYLGLYSSPELAHEAYKKAALELHGEFARF